MSIDPKIGQTNPGPAAGWVAPPSRLTRAVTTWPVLMLFVFASWAAGLPGWVAPRYWYLSYAEGFIRRAFVGTFVAPFLLDRSPEQAMMIVSWLCYLVSFIVLVIITAKLRSLPLPIVIAFLLSNALATLAYNYGNLDIWLVLAVLGAVSLDRLWLALPLCAIAPLIHEGSLWLLLPALGGSWVLRPDLKGRAELGAVLALVSAAVLWLFSTNQFTWLPGTPEVIASGPGEAEFVAWMLGQSFRLYRPALDWQAALFSVLPCAATVLLVARQSGWRAGMIVAFAVFATWSIVLIVAPTDTGRFMAWGPITALLLAEAAIHPRAITHRGMAAIDSGGILSFGWRLLRRSAAR